MNWPGPKYTQGYKLDKAVIYPGIGPTPAGDIFWPVKTVLFLPVVLDTCSNQ